MHLHIVSFNVPWPADYGGVIDVFYRIKALSEAGVRIHLHCYTYGRQPAFELERYCDEVIYYRRKTCPRKLFTRRPYIVSSRTSDQLLARLCEDQYPILLEGLHNAWILERLGGSRILLRAHNVEHEYYSRLSMVESRLFRKLYLRMDARKLRRYEPVMRKAACVLAITEADAGHFKEIGCSNVFLLPPSHQHDDFVCRTGRGDYAVYHADLSVPENVNGATFLINKVFSHSEHRLILVGHNPAPSLLQLAGKHPNVTVVSDPDDDQMERIISDAQVNVLVTEQATGLKLKLIHSLYCGRHCLVNSNMVAGTRLAEACVVADSPESMREALDRLMVQDFTRQHLLYRRRSLGPLYSNRANAQRLVALLSRMR